MRAATISGCGIHARLTEISRGDALNYLKVWSPVIALTVVYPVGTDKAGSVEPSLPGVGRSDAAGRSLIPFLSFCPAPLRAIGHQRDECSCPKSLFFSLFLYPKWLCVPPMGEPDTLDKVAAGRRWRVCSSFTDITLRHQSLCVWS